MGGPLYCAVPSENGPLACLVCLMLLQSGLAVSITEILFTFDFNILGALSDGVHCPNLHHSKLPLRTVCLAFSSRAVGADIPSWDQHWLYTHRPAGLEMPGDLIGCRLLAPWVLRLSVPKGCCHGSEARAALPSTAALGQSLLFSFTAHHLGCCGTARWTNGQIFAYFCSSIHCLGLFLESPTHFPLLCPFPVHSYF